jgi:hypothetical protein
MAVVYETASAATSATSVSSKACNYPTGIASGDLLTCTVISSDGVTPTITNWTSIGTSVAITSALRLTAFYRFAPSALTGTFTVALSGGSACIIEAQRFSGAGSIRGYASTTASSTTAITTTPGAVSANELAWSSSAGQDSSFSSMNVSGTGWTLAASDSNSASYAVNLAYKTTANSTNCVHQYATTIDSLVAAWWVIVPRTFSGLFFGNNF